MTIYDTRLFIHETPVGGFQMYIETRFYDDGRAVAKLHPGFSYPTLDDSGKCDRYVESVGTGAKPVQDDEGSDYESLQAWFEELEIELDDIAPILVRLESGEWVDITAYC